MATRGTYHFVQSGEIVATIYNHWDNYPKGGLGTIREFFDAVKEQTNDTRFGDPSYLAAKFVVFLAQRYAVKRSWEGDKMTEEPGEPLDFLSVGIITPTTEPGDIDYRYYISCEQTWKIEVKEPLVGYERVTTVSYEAGERNGTRTWRFVVSPPEPHVHEFQPVDDLIAALAKEE